MKIVFFAHPLFLNSQSMPRFVDMLANGMKQRGHEIEIWRAEALFSKIPINKLKKWFGYIDQYLIFPFKAKRKIKSNPESVLYVITDHALGPYVPLIAKKNHAIHCHDFLAQYSAVGKITENPLKWSGKLYQTYIRQGFSNGKNFISVSEKTRKDLHEFLPSLPTLSEVVYNGLNPKYTTGDKIAALTTLEKKIKTNLQSGYLLHVGGNQWYKNRVGVIEIYNAWRLSFNNKIPLLLIGESANFNLKQAYLKSPYKEDIYLLTGMDDEFVHQAYIAASVFLFPSLGEGFGWPIAEAMASGCPVITTAGEPMSEVAGNAGLMIPRKPDNLQLVDEWAKESANVVQKVLTFEFSDHKGIVQKGVDNVKRFNPDTALNKIESIYLKILQYDKNKL